MMKRSFDVIVSGAGLLVLLPLLPVAALLIKLDSEGKGEMSLVGPRSEVRQDAEMDRQDFEDVLTDRTGITDPAFLKDCDETSFLGSAADPEEKYLRHVLPDKTRLAKNDVHHCAFYTDSSLILKTIFKLFVSDRLSVSYQSVVIARSDLPGGLVS